MASFKIHGLAAVAALLLTAPAQAKRVELVKPSIADPTVTQFDDPDVIISNSDHDAPLAIFLPGTGGKPQNVEPLLGVVAEQGYRVIGLAYDDIPAVVQICPRLPDPACSAKFREMRVYGDGDGPVTNVRAESIATRLAMLLRYLDQEHPDEGWSGYLTATGSPDWQRILVSGLSQGAGMAAYIAKRAPVYRVVLFSSPWDFVGANRKPAPWISAASATPPDRWWAERHAREATTALIANAYAALQIPADHILLFNADLPRSVGNQENPYHGSTVHDPRYVPDWRTLYGKVAVPSR